MFNKLLFILLLLVAANVYSQTQGYYLGAGTPQDAQGFSCASCHSNGPSGIAQPIYEEWSQTLHAIAQDSMNLPYYGYNCLECHNTGWNPAVTNYGADEFVTMDTSKRPNYVVTDQAGWNKVKNVGCESCHGPAGQQDGFLDSEIHFSATYKPDYSAEVCTQCHRDAHHPYMEEYEQSAHSRGGLDKPFIANNARCQKCHVAQNFVAYMNNPAAYRDTILAVGDQKEPITCTACHDPHSKNFEGQLRAPINSLKTICDECHTADIDSVNINTEPHHTTSEVLSGSKNFGYQYPDQSYPNSGHTFAVLRRCVECHVHQEPFISEQMPAVTGHTFEASVKSCVKCHPDYYSNVDTSNVDKRFDYRGVQTQIDSLMNVLSLRLQKASSQDSTTTAFKEARYNYLAIENEGSHGIHNTRLVKKLLQDAIARFTPTAIEQEAGVPTVYSISQNYPNPFNPVTSIKFSLPQASNVKITIYDVLGNEVETLVNEYRSQGNYKVEWNGAGFTSGVYFYRIEAKDFSVTKKMVLMK